jgi:uncharacterized membrane protein
MQNKQSKNKKHAGVSTGIILGAAFGILFGLLFLDGNIAMGMIFGMLFGIIIGSIFDAKKNLQDCNQQPVISDQIIVGDCGLSFQGGL